MISSRQQDVVRNAGRYQPPRRVRLSEFDGLSMAVILRSGEKRVVLRGTAVYVRDATVGNSLRIRVAGSEPGEPVLVVSEDDWNGRVIPDFHYGCDFCLVIE